MCLPIYQLVKRIHDSPGRVAIAVSGGGSRAIAMLLEVPGASRTIVEAVVPYSDQAMSAYLSGPPEQACSAATARAMAMAAMFRTPRGEVSDTPAAGVSCTASLASDRPKRGPHRAHLAIQTPKMTATRSIELKKGQRTRAEEEKLVARLLLNAVADACQVDGRVELDLLDGERVEESRTVAPQPWQELVLGNVDIVRHDGGADRPDASRLAILSSSFNPIHVGHRRMARAAGEILDMPVQLELPIINADKPPLDYQELERRLGQFEQGEIVWLTRAATFVEKSRLFPGATFVIGADTLARIAEVRFYGNDPTARDAAFEQFAGRGCRFLVFGRDSGDGFENLSDLDLPERLVALCDAVPFEQFHDNASSTALRQAGEW